MLKNIVHIANIKTMADGSIRITIDLLDGTAEDMATAFRLQHEETTMVIAPTEHMDNEL